MLTVVLSLLSAVGLATTAVLSRVGMQGVHRVNATGVSLVVGFLLTLLVVLAVAYSELASVPVAVLPWVLAFGVVHYAIGRSAGFISIDLIGASRASLFVSAQSPIAAFTAIVFTGESLSPLVAVGTVAVVVALVLASGDSLTRGWRTDRRYLAGCLIALLSGAAMGVGFVLSKQTLAIYDSPLVVTNLSMLAAMLFVLPVVAMAVARYPAVRSFDRRSMGFILLSGMGPAVAGAAQFYALQHGDVVIVAPIIATFPLWTLLLSHIFIARLERITVRMVTGALFAVAGVIAVALGGQL